jgi:hypothetical protein
MKRIALMIIFLVGASMYAWSQTTALDIQAGGAPGVMANFKWIETTYDFGKIEQGKPVIHEFTFTNTGGSPLVISNVKGSCGCTVTEYSREPIPPGKTGNVKATFNAAAMGSFHKSIRVTANVEGGAETLFIKGEVVKN